MLPMVQASSTSRCCEQDRRWGSWCCQEWCFFTFSRQDDVHCQSSGGRDVRNEDGLCLDDRCDLRVHKADDWCSQRRWQRLYHIDSLLAVTWSITVDQPRWASRLDVISRVRMLQYSGWHYSTPAVFGVVVVDATSKRGEHFAHLCRLSAA